MFVSHDVCRTHILTSIPSSHHSIGLNIILVVYYRSLQLDGLVIFLGDLFDNLIPLNLSVTLTQMCVLLLELD